jgi:hypothetical protein
MIRRIPTLFAALWLFAAPASAYTRTDTGSPHFADLYWDGGVYEFEIDEASLDADIYGADTFHFFGADFELYVNWITRLWSQATGSAIDMVYGGLTTADCYTGNSVNNIAYVTGDVNSIGSAAWFGGGGPLGETSWSAYSASGELIEADVCVNSNYDWTLQSDDATSRYDLRLLLAHELGHAIGADHTASTVMNSIIGTSQVFVGLWGDDMNFARDVYGTASYDVYSRPLASPSTWGSEVALSQTTNLALDGLVGRYLSDWYVGYAKSNTSRSGFSAGYTTYPTFGSWTLNFETVDHEHPVAVAASAPGSASEDRWVAAVPIARITAGCSAGVRHYGSTNRLATTSTSDDTGICTNHGLALTYDMDSDYFVLAYVGSGFGGTDAGEIYLRTSAATSGIAFSNEVATGNYTDTAPALACRADGSCVLSYVNASSNYRYDYQRTFTVHAGTISLGSTYTSSNWVYFTPDSWATTTGTPDQTYSLLHYSAGTGNGQGTLYSRHDDSYPVNGGSWISVGETTVLPGRMAWSPDRANSFLLYSD